MFRRILSLIAIIFGLAGLVLLLIFPSLVPLPLAWVVFSLGVVTAVGLVAVEVQHADREDKADSKSTPLPQATVAGESGWQRHVLRPGAS